MSRGRGAGVAGRAGEGRVSARVQSVRERIEYWRDTRDKRSPMPEELWKAAASVARVHGVWAVSRALRLNYESLRKRTGRAAAGGIAGGRGSESFVELDAAELVSSREEAKTTVELTSADGAKLMIRLLGNNQALDVLAVANAFWRRGK